MSDMVEREIDGLYDEIAELRSELEEAKEKLDKRNHDAIFWERKFARKDTSEANLRQALEFYAYGDWYGMHDPDYQWTGKSKYTPPEILEDMGETARTALKGGEWDANGNCYVCEGIEPEAYNTAAHEFGREWAFGNTCGHAPGCPKGGE